MRYTDNDRDGEFEMCAKISLTLSKGNAGRLKCDAAMKKLTTASPTSSSTVRRRRRRRSSSDVAKCLQDAGNDAKKRCACYQTYLIDKNSAVLCGSDCADALESMNSDGVEMGLKDAFGNEVLTKCGFSCPEEESSNTGTIVGIVIGTLTQKMVHVSMHTN